MAAPPGCVLLPPPQPRRNVRLYDVYHAINPTFTLGPPRKWPHEYRLVARVEAEDLEQAFDLTNNVEGPWTKNPGVRAVSHGLRSTSVGDVVLAPDGVPYRCESCGWRRVL